MTASPDLVHVLYRLRTLGLLVGSAGLLVCCFSYLQFRERFYPSYLTAFLFWLGLSLGSLAIAMIHGLTGGAWGRTIRRILEAGYETLPLMAVLFFPIWIDAARIYPWADPHYVSHHEVLIRKSAYLTVAGFQIRALVFFAVWIVITMVLNRWSPNDERDPDSDRARRLQNGQWPQLYRVRVHLHPGLCRLVYVVGTPVVFNNVRTDSNCRTRGCGSGLRDSLRRDPKLAFRVVPVGDSKSFERSGKLVARRSNVLGVLFLLSVSRHLVRKSARRKFLVRASIDRGMGVIGDLSGRAPFLGPFFSAAVTDREAELISPALHRWSVAAHALLRSVLDGNPRVSAGTGDIPRIDVRLAVRCRLAHRRRTLDGVVLMAIVAANPAANLRPLAARRTRLSDPAKSTPTPSTPDVGHETTDVRPGIIGLFGLGLVAMVALVLPVLGWVYSTLESRAQRDQRPLSSVSLTEASTGPRLQAQPAVELLKVRREAMTRLTSYGWIDQENGVVHVPVEVAIELLATRGLPAPESPTPEKPQQDAKP